MHLFTVVCYLLRLRSSSQRVHDHSSLTVCTLMGSEIIKRLFNFNVIRDIRVLIKHRTQNHYLVTSGNLSHISYFHDNCVIHCWNNLRGISGYTCTEIYKHGTWYNETTMSCFKITASRNQNITYYIYIYLLQNIDHQHDKSI